MRWLLVLVVLALVAGLAYLGYRAATDDDGPPSPPAGATDDAVARAGDSGDVVAEIQRLLRDAWGYNVVVDGSFGGQTTAAVADFQREYGLEATGVVDAATYSALQAAPPPPGTDSSTVSSTTTPQPTGGTPVTGSPPTEVVDE